MGELDLLDALDRKHDQMSSARETLLPCAPIMVSSSEIEMVAPSNILTPVHQQQCRPSIPYGNDSTMTAVLTCNSTVTDDMLDTVDDCVGCVNQISLQQNFEDSLLNVSLDLQTGSNGLPTISSDDEIEDIATSISAKESRSVFYSPESTSDVVKAEEQEYTPEDSEIDLLNWCSGGFQA